MAVSHYLADNLNDHVLRGSAYTPPASVWLALFEVMPEADGTGGTEVVGGSYARLEVTFTLSALGLAANDTVVMFVDMPACTVRGGALFDDPTAGNMLHFGRFAGPVIVPAGRDLPVPIGDIVARIR